MNATFSASLSEKLVRSFILLFATLGVGCGAGEAGYSEEFDMGTTEQELRTCYVVPNGNAQSHCYCTKPRSDLQLVNTSHCLPGDPAYDRYGSIAACLEAFKSICESGGFKRRLPGSTLEKTPGLEPGATTLAE